MVLDVFVFLTRYSLSNSQTVNEQILKSPVTHCCIILCDTSQWPIGHHTHAEVVSVSDFKPLMNNVEILYVSTALLQKSLDTL